MTAFNFPIGLSAATKQAGDCHACGKQKLRSCSVSAIHATQDCEVCAGTGVERAMHYQGCPNRNLPAHLWIDPRPTVPILTIVPDLPVDTPAATDLPDVAVA